MDRESFDLILEKSGIMNGISTDDYNLLETTARERIEERVRSSDLFERAEEQLKEVLTRYLAALHGSGVKVEFKKKNLKPRPETDKEKQGTQYGVLFFL